MAADDRKAQGSTFDKMKDRLNDLKIGVLGSLRGPSTSSQFEEKATLTPEEFVEAGDLLVYKCPTWKWAGGDAARRNQRMPPNKQFLITKNVPVTADIGGSDRAVQLIDEDPDLQQFYTWSSDGKKDDEVIPEIEVAGSSTPAPIPISSSADNANDDDGDSNDDDIPDMDTYDADDNIDSSFSSKVGKDTDDATLEDNIQHPRTYDVCITYNTYYETPQIWLFGYDEAGNPIKPQDILNDVSASHAHKTVTIKEQPHLGVQYASIHPCRHAEVMKKIISEKQQSGEVFRVDQYLFLFLKFISAVIPTVEYDYTSSI